MEPQREKERERKSSLIPRF